MGFFFLPRPTYLCVAFLSFSFLFEVSLFFLSRARSFSLFLSFSASPFLTKKTQKNKTKQGVRQGRDLPPAREAEARGRAQARPQGRCPARGLGWRPGGARSPPVAAVEDRDGPRVERQSLGPGRRRVPRREAHLQAADQGIHRAQGGRAGAVEGGPVPVARGGLARGPAVVRRRKKRK